MKLTIIPSDGAVYEDGKCYSDLTWGGTPEDVHGLQWEDVAGWIEYKNNTVKLNEDITVLPQWALNAMASWDTANNLAIASIEEVDADFTSVYAEYPNIDARIVQSVLDTQFSGVVISRLYKKNIPNMVGVLVDNVATGAEALSELARLKTVADALGVPVFSNESKYHNPNFIAFMQSRGYEVITISGVSLIKTPWTLALSKNRKNQMLNLRRDAIINAGILIDGNTWDADSQSLTNMLARSNTNDTTVEWRTKDNIMVSKTMEEFKSLLNNITDSIQSIYMDTWDKKAAVESATSEAEVNAI